MCIAGEATLWEAGENWPWNSTMNLSSYAVPDAMGEYRDLACKSRRIANGVVPVGNSSILIEAVAYLPTDWASGAVRYKCGGVLRWACYVGILPGKQHCKAA